MPSWKSVPFSRLIGLITCNIPARWIRRLCLTLFFTAALFSLPIHLTHNGATAKSSHPQLAQGRPSHDLSNLGETYANAALGGTRNEYGPSGLSPAAAQSSFVTISPSQYQTPDGYGDPVYSPSNTGHLSTSASASVYGYGSSSQTQSCRWFAFQPETVSGQITRITLKFDWSTGGSVSTNVPSSDNASASAFFHIRYYNGSQWNYPITRGDSISTYYFGGETRYFGDSGSFSVDLPTNTPINQIIVADQLSADASTGGTEGYASASAYVEASLSNIRLEIEALNCFANVPTDRWKGEYFNNQTLSGSPAMVRDDSIAGTDFLNLNFGGGSPSSACGVIPDNFSARWTRTVNFAQGIYRFTAGVDNGVRLYIDGYLRLDRWGDLPPNTYRADAFLTAGAHEIKLEFIEYTGGASVSLSWAAVAAASSNMAFGKTASQSSTYSVAAADRAIDGNTSGNYYDNSVNHTGYEHQPWWQVDLGSVQQIGAVILWNRTDGSSERLSNFYVLVSDNPFSSTDLTTTINQAGVSSYYTADPVGISKEIGVYRSGRYVRVQLAGDNWLHMAEVEVRGMASRSLALGKSVSQSSTYYGADAFRAVDSNTNGNYYDNSVSITNYEHQPWWQVDLGSVQQIGAVILWNRTDGSSDRLSNFYVLVSDNPFSSTDLTATINQAGVSNYYTASPVGVAKEIGVYRSGRYVRVQLAGDNWLQLAEVEVRSGASGSGCVASVPTDRWKGEYFSNTTLMGSPAMVRDDGGSFLNFGFGSGTPSAACGLSPEFFSARWTRTVNFGASTYRFSVTGDDGVRLYVDGQLKIDAWVLQGPTTYTADVTLSAAPHEIRLEYFEYTGGALAALSWVDLNCFANVPTNLWRGEYFNNITLSGSPAMVRNDGASFLNFDFGLGSPSAACGIVVDNFSARWTRTVNFAASTYRFSVTGDDGVRLYIDGQTKIDKWFPQGATTYTADVALSAGNHEVKLEYFESGGPGVAFLSWADVTGVNCLPNTPLPLISNVPQIGGKDNIASTAPSQAPKRCGQKNSD